jgi:hypothetical protein
MEDAKAGSDIEGRELVDAVNRWRFVHPVCPVTVKGDALEAEGDENCDGGNDNEDAQRPGDLDEFARGEYTQEEEEEREFCEGDREHIEELSVEEKLGCVSQWVLNNVYLLWKC